MTQGPPHPAGLNGRPPSPAVGRGAYGVIPAQAGIQVYSRTSGNAYPTNSFSDLPLSWHPPGQPRRSCRLRRKGPGPLSDGPGFFDLQAKLGLRFGSGGGQAQQFHFIQGGLQDQSAGHVQSAVVLLEGLAGNF